MNIDLDEIVKAIEADPEPSEALADKIGKVGEFALNELLRRLENPDEAGELASTGLLNLANAWMKIEEKRIEAQAQTDQGPEVTALEVILGQPLPPDRKIALIYGFMERLEAQHDAAQDAIQELKGKT